MSIAGHVSPKMLAHYSHVRLEAKRSALDALASRKPNLAMLGGKEEGYVTNNVTTDPADGGATLQITGKYGRPEWTRTIDLFRVKEAL